MFAPPPSPARMLVPPAYRYQQQQKFNIELVEVIKRLALEYEKNKSYWNEFPQRSHKIFGLGYDFGGSRLFIDFLGWTYQRAHEFGDCFIQTWLESRADLMAYIGNLGNGPGGFNHSLWRVLTGVEGEHFLKYFTLADYEKVHARLADLKSSGWKGISVRSFFLAMVYTTAKNHAASLRKRGNSNNRSALVHNEISHTVENPIGGHNQGTVTEVLPVFHHNVQRTLDAPIPPSAFNRYFRIWLPKEPWESFIMAKSTFIANGCNQVRTITHERFREVVVSMDAWSKHWVLVCALEGEVFNLADKARFEHVCRRHERLTDLNGLMFWWLIAADIDTLRTCGLQISHLFNTNAVVAANYSRLNPSRVYTL